MRFAYRTLDLPIQGNGAFIPTPTVPFAASSWGLVKRVGAPGTVAIPAPSPTKIWAPPISADSKTQSSNVSPDLRTPDIYIAYADNMHPPVPTEIHNDIPVPATAWTTVVRKAMIGRKLGTRVAMPWPRVFQRWPTSGGTSAGAV